VRNCYTGQPINVADDGKRYIASAITYSLYLNSITRIYTYSQRKLKCPKNMWAYTQDVPQPWFKIPENHSLDHLSKKKRHKTDARRFLSYAHGEVAVIVKRLFYNYFLCFQTTGRPRIECIIPQAVSHSLMFLKMGKIIARNMSS
jgi:hypothetical protein